MFLKELKIFPFIFLIGTALRILALKSHDFWFDEAITYHFANLPLAILLKATATDFNPPLYYLLMHYVIKISSNELFLRLPSLIFSLLSILVLYYFAKSRINQKVALIGASLLAVSPLSIYLASEARLHSLAILFVPLLIASFFKLLKRPNTSTTLTFILISTLALYTQYYLILLFLSFALIISFAKTKIKIAKFLKIISVPVFALMPWVLFSAQFDHNPCWCPNTLLSLPSSLVSPVISGVGIVTLRSYTNLPMPTLFLLTTTTIITIIFLFKGFLRNWKIASFYLFPIAQVSFLGLFFPVFSPKAFSIFSPIFLVIVALGIDSTKKQILLAPLLVILMGSISAVELNSPFFRGEKLKEVVKITNNDKKAAIVHTSPVTYYSIRFYTQDKQQNLLAANNPLSKTTLNYIDSFQQKIGDQTKNLWLVTTAKWTNPDQTKQALEELFVNFRELEDFQVGNISVIYLSRK